MAQELVATNAKEFIDGLKACVVKIDRKMSNKIRDIVYTLHHEITDRTPVNTGLTLANYQWTIGAPAVTLVEAMGSGPVEPTNTLALGAESRRAPNQAVADASLMALDFSRPYQSFYLTNNNPTVGPLELGEWPEFPFQQRSPNGMFAVSLAHVTELLESGVL